MCDALLSYKCLLLPVSVTQVLKDTKTVECYYCLSCDPKVNNQWSGVILCVSSVEIERPYKVYINSLKKTSRFIKLFCSVLPVQTVRLKKIPLFLMLIVHDTVACY